LSFNIAMHYLRHGLSTILNLICLLDLQVYVVYVMVTFYTTTIYNSTKHK
jgi:hypothetical protein